MAFNGDTAYVIGAATGIGRALVTMLADKGVHIVIGDRNIDGAKQAVQEINRGSQNISISAVYVDMADWSTQVKGMEAAVEALKRIDYVFIVAGVFEQSWLPNRPHVKEFEKPNLTSIEINATGTLYAVSLAIQQFHRQEKNQYVFRVVSVASGAGFHYVPAMPLYTASKHAIVGLVRTLGVTLPNHGVTLNAICPGIVRTAISSGEFYDKLEKDGLLVSMESVLDCFESLMGASAESGNAIEVLPGDYGYGVKHGVPFTNDHVRDRVERWR